jgi:hypothetical protein
MSRWDEIVEEIVADFRKKVEASGMHNFMKNFEEWKSLATERSPRFFVLNDEIKKFIKSCQEKDLSNLFGLNERLRFVLDDVDDREKWAELESDRQMAYKFVDVVQRIKIKVEILKLPAHLQDFVQKSSRSESFK